MLTCYIEFVSLRPQHICIYKGAKSVRIQYYGIVREGPSLEENQCSEFNNS